MRLSNVRGTPSGCAATTHAVCTIVLSVFAAGRLPAQARSVVIARVTDGESGRALAGAQLRLVGLQRAARSDSAGLARLTRVPAGQYEVEVRRLGYSALAVEATLSGADTLELEIALDRLPRQLDTVAVREQGVAPGLEAFEFRRRRGLGQFLAPDDMDAQSTRDLGDVLASRLRGMRVVTGRDGLSRYLVSARPKGAGALSGFAEDLRRTNGRLPRGACAMHVYLDDVFLTDYDVSFLDTRSIAAVEAYGPDAPAQYRRAGSDCGVVLLWSRRSVDR